MSVDIPFLVINDVLTFPSLRVLRSLEVVGRAIIRESQTLLGTQRIVPPAGAQALVIRSSDDTADRAYITELGNFVLSGYADINSLRIGGTDTIDPNRHGLFNTLTLSSLTTNPTLAPGRIWYRSDINKLQFSRDGISVASVLKDDDPLNRITLQVGTAPADPPAGGPYPIYVRQIDANNDGVFVKIKKAGVVTEVQIA